MKKWATLTVKRESIIPNLILSDTGNYQIGKYRRMRHSYLKEHHPILYNHCLLEVTLFERLTENGRTCTDRMEIIVATMAKRGGVTETRKAANQLCRRNHLSV